MKEIAVTRKHYTTRAELERQMDAARQLRTETLVGATSISSHSPGSWG